MVLNPKILSIKWKYLPMLYADSLGERTPIFSRCYSAAMK